MEKVIPVVMVHGGRSRPDQVESFLTTTLRQARQWNDWVILLGGPRVKNYASEAQVGYYNYFSDYYDGVQDFIDNYYVQLSKYTRSYDIAVMERYFVLRDFMVEHDIDVLCNLDSDVMVYCNMSKEVRKFPADMYGAYCIPLNQYEYRLSASSHVSFFTKIGMIELCDFIIDSYSDPKRFSILQAKWDWHIAQNKGGGVCDMTHLYLFYKEYPTLVYNVLAYIGRDGVFEHNINSSENGILDAFRLHGKQKEIVWRQGCPYGFSIKLNEWVRFNTLHLQGGEKWKAGKYFRGSHGH